MDSTMAAPIDLRQHPYKVPKLERTYTDVAADFSYDPNMVAAQTQSIPKTNPAANTLLPPYRNSNRIIQRRLQAAQIARSQSPSSSVSQGESPFRRGSPYRQPNTFQPPRMAVGTAAAARRQNFEANTAYTKSSVTSREEAQLKTISPKDVLLDYQEANESKVPLFLGGGIIESLQSNLRKEVSPEESEETTYHPDAVMQSFMAATTGASYMQNNAVSSPPQESGFSYDMFTDREDTPSRITNLNGRYEHWIPGYANDIKVVAFPDNCSALNIISEDFANQNKLAIDRTKLTTIRLPNRDTIQSSGSLKLKFRFDGEITIFDLVFTVLPSCVCNIVLSSDFLRFTKTFTTFKSRIRRWYTPSIRPRPRVCLQGSPKQQVIGSINGHAVSAFPDTGSDVNVISKAYAESIGLKISTDPDAMETLEFIDGSSMITCGIVYDVEWKFGAVPNPPALVPQTGGNPKGKVKNVQDWEYGSNARPASTFICNFYVLEILSCPIILSADLLYGTNAFTACAEHFHESINFSRKRQLEGADVYLLKKRRKTMREWANKVFSRTKTTDCLPNNPPTLSQSRVEARRRLYAQDRIDDLPLHEQAAAHEVERLRNQQWAQNNLTQNLQTTQQPAPQSTPPQAASDPNAQETT